MDKLAGTERRPDSNPRTYEMSTQTSLTVAQNFLGNLGRGDTKAVAELFAEDAQWDIPGDTTAFPWIGRKNGSNAVVEFIETSTQLIERIKLEVQDILANERRAVILGELASRVRSTGKVIETPFAVILGITDGKISHYRMLENSYAVSLAVNTGAAA